MSRLAIAARDAQGALSVGETWSAEGKVDNDEEGQMALTFGTYPGEWGVDWDVLYEPLNSFRGCRVRITVTLLEKP